MRVLIVVTVRTVRVVRVVRVLIVVTVRIVRVMTAIRAHGGEMTVIGARVSSAIALRSAFVRRGTGTAPRAWTYPISLRM